MLTGELEDALIIGDAVQCGAVGDTMLTVLREMDMAALSADAKRGHFFGDEKTSRVELFDSLLALTPRKEARAVLTVVGGLKAKHSSVADDLVSARYWDGLAHMYATSLTRDEALPSEHSLSVVLGVEDAAASGSLMEERVYGGVARAEEANLEALRSASEREGRKGRGSVA